MPLAGIGSRFIALLVDYLIWAQVCSCGDSGASLFAGLAGFSAKSRNGPKLSRSLFCSFSTGLLHAV